MVKNLLVLIIFYKMSTDNYKTGSKVAILEERQKYFNQLKKIDTYLYCIYNDTVGPRMTV